MVRASCLNADVTLGGMRVPPPWRTDTATSRGSRCRRLPGDGQVSGDRKVADRGRRGRCPRPSLAVALVPVLIWALAGCSAPIRPDPPSASPPAAEVRIPADGITLKRIGFENGPAEAFSLPRSIVIVTAVDQASGVTVVFSHPSASELASYLRRTLPKTGFQVSQFDPATASLTFTGYGWHGSFTGDGDSSAVILRP